MWTHEVGQEILLLSWEFALLWEDQWVKSYCWEGSRHQAQCCKFWKKISVKCCARFDEGETGIHLCGKNQA